MIKRIKHKVKKVKPVKNKQYIYIPDSKGYNKVFFKEITYFQAARSYCDVHLIDHTKYEHVSFSMADFMRCIPHAIFFRIHKSFIINMEHIKRVGKLELLMDDGGTVDAARDKIKILMSLLPVVRHGRKKNK